MKPAHGKYLLMASNCSDDVTAALQKKYTEDDWRPTTRELLSKICDLFNTHHQRLADPGYWAAFDQQHECKGCKNKKKISSGAGQESLYCLDTPCYQQKKAAAESERTQERQQDGASLESETYTPQTFELNHNNQVEVDNQQLQILQDWRDFENADFDLGGCDNCEHHLEAIHKDKTIPACFNIQCYQQKLTANNVDHRLAVQHLKTCCANRIISDNVTASRFLLWLAATSPEGVGSNESGKYVDMENYPAISESEMENVLLKHNLVSVTDFFADKAIDGSNEIIQPYIMALSNQTLIEICNHFNITIDGYRINKDYIEAHTQDELERLSESVNLLPGTYATLGDDGLLKHCDVIGVPPGIQWAWQQLTATEAEQ